MAEDVARVARRCEDAKEQQQLDLSSCRLTKIPDAIYHVLREIHLVHCSLDDNLLRLLPRKFCSRFTGLRELTVSGNRLSQLPNEMVEMVALERLDISRNQFTEFPAVLIQLPTISHILARDNAMVVIDTETVREMKALKELDVRGNPLPGVAANLLARIDGIKIHVDVPVAPNDASSEASGVSCNKLDEVN